MLCNQLKLYNCYPTTISVLYTISIIRDKHGCVVHMYLNTRRLHHPRLPLTMLNFRDTLSLYTIAWYHHEPIVCQCHAILLLSFFNDEVVPLTADGLASCSYLANGNWCSGNQHMGKHPGNHPCSQCYNSPVNNTPTLCIHSGPISSTWYDSPLHSYWSNDLRKTHRLWYGLIFRKMSPLQTLSSELLMQSLFLEYKACKHLWCRKLSVHWAACVGNCARNI